MSSAETIKKVCLAVDKAIMVFETVFLTVALGVMAGVLFAQVVCEYLGANLTWAGELSMYLLVWVMCVGSSAATRGRRHISVGLISDRLRGRAARAAKSAVAVLCSLMCCLGCVLGVEFARMAYEHGQKSVAIGAPLWTVYAALPVAAGLMAVRFLILSLRYAPSAREDEEEGSRLLRGEEDAE